MKTPPKLLEPGSLKLRIPVNEMRFAHSLREKEVTVLFLFPFCLFVFGRSGQEVSRDLEAASQVPVRRLRGELQAAPLDSAGFRTRRRASRKGKGQSLRGGTRAGARRV